MKRLIDPELALAVENADGEPVAVAVVLLDANEVLSRVRSGRLLPVGWYRLLRDLPGVSQARVFALGVKPEQENLALGPLLYAEIIDRLWARPNIVGTEASWILATNQRMNGAIEAVGGKRYKTWRLYQRPV
jgi:ribosomal protein S18 acetylase RimI-like enzyme